MAAESSESTTLSVHLNRADLHSIEVPASFATADSFVVELDNHGEAAHVHLRLDEGLSEVASVPSSNHYVRPGATTRVPISVHDTGPVTGLLTIATAYGSHTEEVELAVEPTAGKRRVEIDDSLVESSGGGSVEPTRTTPTNASRRTTAGSATGTNTVTAGTGIGTPALLAAAAVVVIVAVALLFAPGITEYIGALAVVVGVLAAAYLLLY